MCHEPWYADIVSYLTTGQISSDWSSQDRHLFFTQVRFFILEESYIFKYCPDQIIRRCLPEDEHRSVLAFCHELACGGNFGPCKTAEKSCRVGSTGLLFSKTLSIFSSCAKTAK